MKTSPEVLIKDIAGDLVPFLMQGNLTPYLCELDPCLEIDNVEKLLRIHFVLTNDDERGKPGVIPFLLRLPDRLRCVRTSVEHNLQVTRGEVRGKIDWQETVRTRYRRREADATLFACDLTQKNYQTPENIILKSLLRIIGRIAATDLRYGVIHQYGWLADWWNDNQKLLRVLHEALYRNVYIRSTDLPSFAVTDTMLSRVALSRLPLYRDAARLMQRYRDLMRYEFDTVEAEQLLRNTFIRPDKTDVLFELYWAIRIARQFPFRRYRLIESGSDEIAAWDAGVYSYKLFHNCTGSLDFSAAFAATGGVIGDADNYFGRQHNVLSWMDKMVPGFSDWAGRPDIVLEKRDSSNKLCSILIGEVKYTENKRYAIQGLKELMEYVAHVKSAGNYIEQHDDLFSRLQIIKPVLFLDAGADLSIDQNEVDIARFGNNFTIDI